MHILEEELSLERVVMKTEKNIMTAIKIAGFIRKEI